MAREITDKDLAYELLGEEGFREGVSAYDTARRIEILIEEFLGEEEIEGKTILEVGCGLGYFSGELDKRGSLLTVSDISPSLVDKVSSDLGCRGVVADALKLTETFEADSFDGILSSECIEHTPDPLKAVCEMTQLIKPGGWIALSTPNRIWQPVVRAATRVGARPFSGYENFSTFSNLRRQLENGGFEVEVLKGLHPWPFQLGLHGTARIVEKYCQFAKGLMINLCVFARKRT